MKEREEEAKKEQEESEEDEKPDKDSGVPMFIKLVMGMLAKMIPFSILRVCIPAFMILNTNPEAGIFPHQMYHILNMKEKVADYKLAAKGFVGWLNINKHAEEFDETLYFICAQTYMSLYSSKIFPVCNPLSMMIFNPMVMAGIMPDDLPICLVQCIIGMATCQVKMPDLVPCDIFSLYNAIQSIFDLNLRF